MLKKVVDIYHVFPLLNHYSWFFTFYHFIWRSSWNPKKKKHHILAKFVKFILFIEFCQNEQSLWGKKIIGQQGRDLTSIQNQKEIDYTGHLVMF
jgi:hypothetical protein